MSETRIICEGGCGFPRAFCRCAAAVTPLGEGGDEPWRCMAPRSHGLRCCVLNDRDDETCGACGSDRPRGVSLPPQRSDETAANWSDWKAHLIVCAECTAGHPCDAGWSILGRSTPDQAPWLASSGAGAEEKLEAALTWMKREQDARIAAESEVTTLRAQLAEARKEIEELREHT